MANAFWKRVRGGTSGARVFSAYMALVLTVAVAGPGLAVYATEGGVAAESDPAAVLPVEEVVELGMPVVEVPGEEPPAKESAGEPEAVVETEPVLEAAVEPVIVPAEASVEAPIAPFALMMSARAPVTDENDSSWICAGGVKLDSDPRTGTYIPSTSNTEETPTTPTDYSITITTYAGPDGAMLMDFTSNYPVSYVKVKGSNAAQFYTYDPPVYSATGLHAPINASGEYADISHIVFCFGTLPVTGDLEVYKYLDANENGEYDEGEEMLEDWEFTAYDSEDSVVGSGSTDEDGKIVFDALLPGEYHVTETLEDGWDNTTDLTQYQTVVAPGIVQLWFGNIPEEQAPETGDLIIHKFYDENENGEYDEGEEMLEGWEFTVTLEGSGLTDADGELLFSNLSPDVYTVTETLQEGWDNTTPLTQEVTVVAGQTAHVWFGNIEEFLPFTWLDLAITKLADDHTVTGGQLVTYTLTYWNDGNLSAEDYTIVDDFDERYVSVVNANGGSVSGGKITWTFPGPLSAEMGMQTLTYTVRVIADMPVGTTNIDNVVVIGHPLDDNTSNNVDDERIVVRITADEPFLPFTEDEPFLPFTGGEFMLLIVAAIVAGTVGLALRLTPRKIS